MYCFQLFVAPWFPSVTPQPNSPKASQPSALIARTDPSIQAATKGTAAATDMVWNFAGPDLVGGLVHVTDLGGSYFYKDEWNSDSLLEMKQSIENLKNPIFQVIPYDENTGVIRDGMGTIVGVVVIVEGGVTLLKNAPKIVEKTGNLFKSLEEFYKGSSLSSTRGGDLLATGTKSIKSVDEMFPGVGKGAGDISVVDAIKVLRTASGAGDELSHASKIASNVKSVDELFPGVGGERAKIPENMNLLWHGSVDAVERRNISGIFTDGPRNGGLFWATSKNIDEIGVLDWRIGANTNVKIFPPAFINKGGIEATYELTSTESALFKKAWGTDFSWNPFQWWKGAAGQYYYREGAASTTQRIEELTKAAGTVGAAGGAAWGAAELNKDK